MERLRMNRLETIQKIRKITMSPINKIDEALTAANDDMDKAIELLVNQMTKTEIHDMNKRTASNNIVYSYVHNNRIGAMIVIATETDFAARNELFLGLAKDICMHIVSSPNIPKYLTENDILPLDAGASRALFESEVRNKPDNIKEKIIAGKLNKWYDEVCLCRQKFVKDETITIAELIAKVSSTLGEKIELKKFVRMIASEN